MLRYVMPILFIFLSLLFVQLAVSTSDANPILDVEYSFIDVAVNTSLVLQCSGTKPLKWRFIDPVEWRDRDLIAQNVNNINGNYISTIDLYFTSSEDTGRYSCYYENAPHLSTALYVFVDDFSRLLLPGPDGDILFLNVYQARRTRIPCCPINSKINVTFWKVANPPILISISDVVTFDPTEGFFLKIPSDYYSGSFECKANFEQREHVTDLYLEFIREPQSVPQIFIDDHLAKYVLVGSNFSLICTVRVEVSTYVVIEWSAPSSDRIVIEKQESTKVPSDSQFTQTSEKLTVIGAKKEDEGIYQCNATDHSKKANYFEVHVRVYGAPQETILNFTSPIDSNNPIIKNKGENVELKSSFIVFPASKKYSLTWRKDGIPLTSKIEHYQMRHSDSESVLTILDLRGDDSGTYTLIGETSGGVSNVSFQLFVKDLPQVDIQNSEPCCYLEGKNYTIRCLSRGYPVPRISWWWKPYCLSQCSSAVDWTEIHDDDDDIYTTIGLQETGFPFAALQVKAQQSGYYKCKAENEVGITYQNISFIITDIPNGFGISADNKKPVELDEFSMKCMGNVIMFSNIGWTWKPTYNNNYSMSLDNNTSFFSTPHSTLATIKFDSITRNQSGVYECSGSYRYDPSKSEKNSVNISVRGVKKPYFVATNMNNSIYRVEPNEIFEFICYVNGTPRPNISWFRDDKIFSTNTSWGRFYDEMQKLVISRVVPEDSGYYTCRAENRAGVVQQNATLIVLSDETKTAAPLEGMDKNQVITFVVVTVIASLCFVLLLVFFGRCIYMRKKTKRTLQLFNHKCFKEGQMAIFNPDMPLDDQAELLPYDERWEFSKDRLKLGRTLGQGAFGRVVKAEAIGINDSESSTTVAVKMLKERADINQQKALMAELKILIHLGHHLNIVNLMGAVTKSIQYGELYIIVEYCKYGNLRHFLLRHRDKFVDQGNATTYRKISGGLSFQSSSKPSFSDSDQSPISPSSSLFSIENPSYRQQLISHSPDKYQCQMSTFGKMSEVNMNEGFSTSCSTESSGTTKIYSRLDSKEHIISTCDLLCFAFQSARGMEYLASKKLIHRDLAARNVLLAEDYIVKICDFGLAKDCYKYSNYVKKGNGPLPIKWMAIESLADKVYTTKSDVWSFGVLLWEFFTLGGNPYPGVEVDNEFYRRLKMGYKMSKPELCPDMIYQIMRDCWQNEAKDRPDFTELASILGGLLESSVRQHYIDLNDPYQEMNQKQSNHVYLNDLQPETSYVNTSDFSQDLKQYDEVPHIRSISDNPVPKQAMEVVPMIRLDSVTEENQDVKTNAKRQEENVNQEQYIPDYLCMGNSPTKAPALQDDDSVFF